jgi:hypothetical protein
MLWMMIGKNYEQLIKISRTSREGRTIPEYKLAERINSGTNLSGPYIDGIKNSKTVFARNVFIWTVFPRTVNHRKAKI